MQLSATGTPTTDRFAFAVDAHRSHPVAGRRLSAGKRLTTRAATAKTCVTGLVDAVVEQLDALSAAEGGYAPTALVVCNTVDRARAVYIQLQKALAGRGAVDCDLLIGRARPLDRQAVQVVWPCARSAAATCHRRNVSRSPICAMPA